MQNCREIDEDYYVGQKSEGASWTILYAPPGRDQCTVGYYTATTSVLSWTDSMPREDKTFVEIWVRENLRSQ